MIDLLLTHSGATPAPPGGGGTGDPAIPGYSTAMPTAATYGARVFHAGAGQPYASIVAAKTAAVAARAGLPGSARSLIVVHPGDYDETVAIGPYVDLAGATANPADVHIHNANLNGGSPIWASGPTFIGGVTVRLDPVPEGQTRQGTGIYDGFHLSNQAMSLVLEKCVMGSAGADFAGFGRAYFIECAFLAPGQMNLHGWPVNAGPVLVAFVDCTAAAGVKLSYNTFNSPHPDEVWIVGTVAPGWSVEGANATVRVSPNAGAPSRCDGSLVVTTGRPPMPMRGV